MSAADALNSPALVASLAMLMGVFAQVIARHANVPGIVLLLIVGVLLGPDVANVVRPQALGKGLEGVVGFAVAIILFEGGLNLNWRVLRRQAKPIQRLVLFGSAVTAAGGAAAASLFMHWGWRRAFLFGTLVIVTGPTVITPLLRRIRARRSVETILEAEGIFIDAVGATIAVVALEVLLAPADQRLGTAVMGIVMRFGVGTLVGLVGGAAFALLMRFRFALPEGLGNIAALASAVAIFQISNAIVPESGISAAIIAGMVVGHTRSHDIEELRHFKEQITVLLVATLFVLLAADVRLADVVALGWPGVLTVLALILVVRPVNVAVSTFRTELEGKERLFLAWLAPRGIVAAAVSSLFAERMTEAGLEGGTQIRALVFLVIATTVVMQGMTAGLVARLLGVRLPTEVGYVLLGADEMARCIGAALARSGEEVVFIDTNPDAARAAEEAGFKVVFGDGLDDRSLIKARIQIRRGCIGATANESVNFLFANKVHASAKEVSTYVAIERSADGVSSEMVKQSRSRLLFAGARELAQWGVNADKKRVVLQDWQSSTETEDGSAFEGMPPGALPLVLFRDKVAFPAIRSYRAQKEDVIHLAVAADRVEEIADWLGEKGWTKIDESSIHPPAVPTA